VAGLGGGVVKKAAPIKEKIEKELKKQEKARKRAGLLRETGLLRFRWVPNFRKILEYVAEGLFQGAGAQPLDPKLLGESIRRAKLRAVGYELRHLQEVVEEVADDPQPEDSDSGATLDPTDRRLCKWAAEQRRDITRLAVRFERRVGPAPDKANG
jgi:hypothetical protein